MIDQFVTQELTVSDTPDEQELIKKYRQINADVKAEIDDLIDVKLAKMQRKTEEDEVSLG